MLFHNKITRKGQQKWNNHLSVCLSGGRLTVTSRHSPGSLFPVGETVVQYTATDAAGNSRTCNLTVTVQGIRAPLHLSDVPAPQGTLSLFFLSCVMRMKYTVNKTKHQCQCPFAVPEFFSFIVQSCMKVIRHWAPTWENHGSALCVFAQGQRVTSRTSQWMESSSVLKRRKESTVLSTVKTAIASLRMLSTATSVPTTASGSQPTLQTDQTVHVSVAEYIYICLYIHAVCLTVYFQFQKKNFSSLGGREHQCATAKTKHSINKTQLDHENQQENTGLLPTYIYVIHRYIQGALFKLF